MSACGFQPTDLSYAPCTREVGHDGPCAHPLALTALEEMKRIASDLDEAMGDVCFSLGEIRDCINSAPDGWRKDQCLAALKRVNDATLERFVTSQQLEAMAESVRHRGDAMDDIDQPDTREANQCMTALREAAFNLRKAAEQMVIAERYVKPTTHAEKPDSEV